MGTFRPGHANVIPAIIYNNIITIIMTWPQPCSGWPRYVGRSIINYYIVTVLLAY